MEYLNRQAQRRFYFESWQGAQRGEPLTPLQQQVVAVVALHPEYHAIIAGGEALLEAEFPPEQGQSNPYLHMGLHLALQDQIRTDKPPGVAQIYAQLQQRLQGDHAAEHLMLEVLAETLWQQQRSGVAIEPLLYLERLRQL
ncbi:MAG: DUF1841 family protein [Gammaproteobacteria bacterium]|nr:DUF1841 family protein [Gammaproteobacteria bacterium]